MRITCADVAAVARAVMAMPAQRRASRAAAIVRAARIAARHRAATGQAHPRFGAGSLMEVARKRPLPPEPGFDDRDYRAAFALVLSLLRDGHDCGA